MLETAELAGSGDPAAFTELRKRLHDSHPVVRYWAATGCTVLSTRAGKARRSLQKLLHDPEISVRIAAAEALYLMGDKNAPLNALSEALASDNIMARVQALNVLDSMGDDAGPLLDKIRQLKKDNIQDGDYDVRAALRIIEKMKN